MDEPLSPRIVIGRHPLRRRPRRRLTPGQRRLLRFLRPLIKGMVYLETFIRTRWEVIPVDELPEAKERWHDPGMSREDVRQWVEDPHDFLCPQCNQEITPTRQEFDELFTDVWEVRKYGRCEPCAADREHLCRMHHGFLAFLRDGRWMVLFPHVPFLRRLWLMLRP